MSFSDNAVMAKVRAMYGKRLTPHDYDQMLSKKSVGEVAAYLKNETYYGSSLSQVKEDLVHRGQLETLVRRRTLDLYQSLLKYSYEDSLFFQRYLMDAEVEQLLLVIRLLNAGEMGHYIISLPGYLASHMSFDLYALAGITDFDGLLEVLRHSHYHDVVARFRTRGRIDITGCERALLTHYYTYLLELVKEGGYSAETRKELEELLELEVGFHNLQVIYRMKRFFSGSPERIEECLLPLKSSLGADFTEKLLRLDDIGELFEALAGTRMFRGSPLRPDGDEGHLVCQMYQVRQRLCRRMFRFSVKPSIVVLSYMNLLEIEINNITNIIEGIRYSVPADEIRSLLALA